MDWLNFHHLRYFYYVAKEGSLRAAAEKMHVSQPSISLQLRQLDEALGQSLFRRTGRRLQLTDIGRLTFGYAEAIFSTGDELQHAVREGALARAPMFHVGITDSLPKLVAHGMLQPALRLRPAPRLVCREGQLDELLPLLAAHRLDLVLADESASSSHKYRLFNHALGSCGVTFCAHPRIAKRLRNNFPASLQGAPMLLPTEGSSLRRAVHRWLDERGLQPTIIGEFDDTALMAFFARDGAGVFPLHSVAVPDALKSLRLSRVGDAPECRCHLHAITMERRVKHPASLAITSHAQQETAK